jgi:hypothetical protein
MDLFEAVSFGETGNPKPSTDQEIGQRLVVCMTVVEPDEQELADWINDQELPPDEAELEAQMLGQERAGLPSVSKAGLAVRARWRAFIEAQPIGLRPALERAEDEGYRAARRRVAWLPAIADEEE